MATNSQKKKEKPQETAPVRKADPSEQLMPFMIPIDPAQADGQQFLEVCINGKIGRFPRGEMLELPKYLVEFIIERDALSKANRSDYSGFSTGAGVEIGWR